MFDLVLKGGTLYDGLGGEGYIADIGIENQQITAIGDLSTAESHSYVDVTGLAVSPGFIDMHTHSDFTLLANKRAESQVHQGVTTEVVGQCGFSSAPAACDHDAQEMSFGFKKGCVEFGWRSFGEYLDRLEARSLGVNVAAFVGHGSLYRAVMGDEKNAPSTRKCRKWPRCLIPPFRKGRWDFHPALNTGQGN